MLRRYRLPCLRPVPLQSRKEAERALARMGAPVVLKADTDTSAHKSRLGLVSVAHTREQASKAYRSISARARGISRNSRVIAQPFMKGAELMVGGKQDPVFGSILLAGLGGVFVEERKQVAIRLAPVTQREALSMLGEVRFQDAMEAAHARCNIGTLARILVNASQLAAREKAEFDFNPVIVGRNSARIADQRILRPQSP